MSSRASDSSTGTVLLRDVTEADLSIFFEDQMDPQAIRMAAFQPRDQDAFAKHWMKILNDASATKKTILVDGQVAGYMVGFEKAGKPLVGYWIGKRYWGKGVATRALCLFLDHLTARPLFAHVAKHNVASIRVLEKCGFTICGEEKEVSDTGGEEVEEYIFRLDAASTASP
jgi:RimJ/RimL family protein N-acetyltransferase